jgi:hypothetical protein
VKQPEEGHMKTTAAVALFFAITMSVSHEIAYADECTYIGIYNFTQGQKKVDKLSELQKSGSAEGTHTIELPHILFDDNSKQVFRCDEIDYDKFCNQKYNGKRVKITGDCRKLATTIKKIEVLKDSDKRPSMKPDERELPTNVEGVYWAVIGDVSVKVSIKKNGDKYEMEWNIQKRNTDRCFATEKATLKGNKLIGTFEKTKTKFEYPVYIRSIELPSYKFAGTECDLRSEITGTLNKIK